MTASAFWPWSLQVDGQVRYDAVVMACTATGGGLVCTLPLRPQEADTEIPPITDTYSDGKVLEHLSVQEIDAISRGIEPTTYARQPHW